MDHQWTFPAHCTGVVNGDTLDLVVSLGFRCTREVRVQLLHVDTAETHGTPEDTEEYERAEQQAQFVREWLAEAEGQPQQNSPWPLTVRTEKATGKYGRYLATVERPDGELLHEALAAEYPEVAE